MSSRYVELPNGSYLEWPEGVSAATFKAKATKLMGGSPLPRDPSKDVKRPEIPKELQGQNPFVSRTLDRIGDDLESTIKSPGMVANRSRDLFKQGQETGGWKGAAQMGAAPGRAIGEAGGQLLKGVAGITGPGILYRLFGKHEDPANIEGDAIVAFGMMGEPEVSSGKGMSPMQAAKEITDAVNPVPKQMASFQKSVGEHLDQITTFAKTNGINIDSLEGLGKAMKGAGDWIKNHYYNELLGPVKERPVSLAGIKGYSGETASPSTATLGQLDARLSQINAELNPKYAKGGIAGQAAVKSSIELNAEAAGIRKELYGGVAKATGLDPEVVAKTRGSFGALDDLAEKTNMAASKSRHAANAAEQGPVSLNPLSSTKHFVADKAISKLRGDVSGKSLSKTLGKVKVPEYKLPKPSHTQAPTGTSYNPIRGVSKEVPTFGSEDVGSEVRGKLSRRQQANELARKQAAQKASEESQARQVRSSRHPQWKFGVDEE